MTTTTTIFLGCDSIEINLVVHNFCSHILTEFVFTTFVFNFHSELLFFFLSFCSLFYSQNLLTTFVRKFSTQLLEGVPKKADHNVLRSVSLIAQAISMPKNTAFIKKRSFISRSPPVRG